MRCKRESEEEEIGGELAKGAEQGSGMLDCCRQRGVVLMPQLGFKRRTRSGMEHGGQLRAPIPGDRFADVKRRAYEVLSASKIWRAGGGRADAPVEASIDGIEKMRGSETVWSRGGGVDGVGVEDRALEALDRLSAISDPRTRSRLISILSEGRTAAQWAVRGLEGGGEGLRAAVEDCRRLERGPDEVVFGSWLAWMRLASIVSR